MVKNMAKEFSEKELMAQVKEDIANCQVISNKLKSIISMFKHADPSATYTRMMTGLMQMWITMIDQRKEMVEKCQT
jgi:hypothetical protein